MKAVDISDAMEEWSELDDNPLPKACHAQWARAWINYQVGVSNESIYKQVYNELSGYAEAASGKTQGELPAVDRRPDSTPKVEGLSTVGVYKDGNADTKTSTDEPVVTRKKKVVKGAKAQSL